MKNPFCEAEGISADHGLVHLSDWNRLNDNFLTFLDQSVDAIVSNFCSKCNKKFQSLEQSFKFFYRFLDITHAPFAVFRLRRRLLRLRSGQQTVYIEHILSQGRIHCDIFYLKGEDKNR